MKDVVSKLKKELQHLESVYYRQDNAGCYHCGASITGANLIGKDTVVFVRRMDFSDPQGGKGACDRKAKSHMKIHLNAGNNIETGQEMVAAMLSSGGIPGVHATLAIPPTFPRPVSAKLEGVSAISNIKYRKDHLRVWRAYGIGSGKVVPLSKTGIRNEMTIPNLGEDITESNQLSDQHFTPTRANPLRPQKSFSPQQCQVTADELNSLYSCPEEGCMKTYQCFSALQHHLDCGRHECALEHETLLDKAAHGYSERLQGQSGSFPELPPAAHPDSAAQPSLQMGWAPKSSQGRRTKRFSDKQKNYLFTRFLIRICKLVPGFLLPQSINTLKIYKIYLSTRINNKTLAQQETFEQLSLKMSYKHKVAATSMIVPCDEISFCLVLGKRYPREVEISEYDEVNKQPTVLGRIVTTSRVLLK